MKTKRIFILLLALCMISTLIMPSAVSAQSENIVKGLDYTIEFTASTEGSYRNYVEHGEEFDIDSGMMLTDGKYASSSLSDKGYYHAFRSKGRRICFDLGCEMRIDGFCGSFYSYGAGSGVYTPTYMKLWLSDDGEHYVCCETKDGYETYTPSAKKVKVSLEAEKPYKARYVKVEFEVGVFVYCDEIEVYGKNDVSGCQSVPAYTEPAVPGVYPQGEDRMNGASSIIKIYDGYYTTQSKADNTAEELLPYISYMEKGKVVDTMFDTVAFVPCAVEYPSGGRMAPSDNQQGGTMSDWELYASHTFKEGANLHALDEATATRNEALGINEKVKVMLTIPFSPMSSKPFGDINGDGKNEYTRTLEERAAIVRWYVDMVCTKFRECDFKNIELIGFYWMREEMPYQLSDHEDKLIGEAKKAIDEILPGGCLLYDPFYLSQGWDRWESYGFDGAVMQPNFAHKDYFTTEMLEEFASQIKEHRVGVEIETAEPSYFKTAEAKEKGENYEKYLFYGWKDGYMNALQTYYQGAGPGTIYVLYTSSDPYLNYLYKLTYKFIKKTYSPEKIELSVGNIAVRPDSSQNTFALSFTESDIYKADISASSVSAHGKTTVRPSTSKLTYTPEKGFTGCDNVTVELTDAFGRKSEASFKAIVGNGASLVTGMLSGIDAAAK